MRAIEITECDTLNNPPPRPYERLRLPPESEAFAPDARCIRLLDILPATGDQALSPLEGRLRIIDLAHREPYAALSYVWGIDNEHKNVTIGDVGLLITANGYSALLHLRKKLNTTFSIWVDAICIDQENEKEKERQIPLMGDIYNQAERVYIWLGDGNPASDRAMQLLGKTGLLDCFFSDIEKSQSLRRPRVWRAFWRLFNPFRRHKNNLLPRYADKLKWFRTLRYGRLPCLDRKQASYDDLNDVLSRPWIKRMWTFQEIVLANNPVVVCGDYHLSWQRFTWNVLCLESLTPQGQAQESGLSDALNAWITLTRTRSHFLDLRQRGERINQEDQSALDSIEVQRRHIMSVYDGIVWRAILVGSMPLIICLGVTFGLFLSPIVTDWPETTELPVRLSFSFWNLVCEISFIFAAIHLLLRINRRRIEPGFQWVDGILNRSAKMQKDKSFAVHAIMQKVTSHPLPAPDYSQTVDQVFRDLCLTIANATSSLNFLLIAAVKGLENSASWVADWSEPIDSVWKVVYPIEIGLRDATWSCRDNDHDALLVQGRQLGVVDSVFSFEEAAIWTGNETEEKGIHARNLLTILELASSCHCDLISYMLRAFEGIRSRESLDDKSISDGDVYIWSNVMRLWCRQDGDTDEYYRIWRRRPGWMLTLYILRWRLLVPLAGIRKHFLLSALRVNVLELNERICNRLARSRRRFLSCSAEDGSEVAIGTNRILKGDRVVYIYGVPCCLVIRGEDSAACLVSPAISGGDYQPSRAFSAPPRHRLKSFEPTETELSELPLLKLRLV